MKRVLLAICVICAAVVFVALSSVIVILYFGNRMRSSFESASSEVEAGPLERSSASAVLYDDKIAAEPTFVVRDDKKPDEAVAVFVSEQKLQEHGVTAEQYEKEYLQFSEAFARAMVSAAVDMMFGEQDGEQNNEPEATEYEPPVWFHDLLENTRVEVWRFKADGTHEVIDAFSYRERIQQPAHAAAE